MNGRDRGDIQKADPQARRRAVIIVIVGAAVGTATILLARLLQPRVVEWVTGDTDSRWPVVALALGAPVVLPLLVVGAYLWRLGSRIVVARRFPLPGAGLIRDTPVAQGAAAEARGRAVRTFGMLLVVAAVACALVLWRLFAALIASSSGPYPSEVQWLSSAAPGSQGARSENIVHI